jgi:protein-S-isoprenylcysteine O-methyltransferase Ste14
MDGAWYLRLFYMPLINLFVSVILYKIIKAERMTGPGPGRLWAILYFVELTMLCGILWFIPFHINWAFWAGICVIISGHSIFTLGYIAMRAHPEKKKTVVDWGIYGISRNSHMIAAKITTLGVIIMGWSPHSIMYGVLWAYFLLEIMLTHWYVISEERMNIERFGDEYKEYMKCVPRYL